MNQIEDRLTTLLAQSAEAVDVEPDLDGVMDGFPAVVALDDRRGRTRRRSAIFLAGAAATVTVAVATYAISRPGEDVDVRNPATSPADDGGTGDPAEGNGGNPDTPPRFLFTADGWELESLDADNGESDSTAFYRDSSGRTIAIERSSREDTEAWVNDAFAAENQDIGENFSDPLSTADTATGQEITFYERTGGGWAAAWYHGDYGFFSDTNTFSPDYDIPLGDDADEYIPLDEFTEIVGTVELVDEATWLAALPDDHATDEDERASAVDSALEEVPLPDGMTAETILADMGDLIGPEAQVEREVVGAVTCGWIDVWIAADDADDADLRQEAADALASSDQWPVLADPYPEDWATAIGEVAEAMAADERIEVTTGTDPVSGSTQGEGYLRHIPCFSSLD